MYLPWVHINGYSVEQNLNFSTMICDVIIYKPYFVENIMYLKYNVYLHVKKYNKALFTWLIVTMINKHHVYIMWLKMTQNQSFVLISWFLKLSPNRWFSFCQIWNQPKHDGLLINGAIPVNLGMIICFERYAKTVDLFFIHNAILIS